MPVCFICRLLINAGLDIKASRLHIMTLMAKLLSCSCCKIILYQHESHLNPYELGIRCIGYRFINVLMRKVEVFCHVDFSAGVLRTCLTNKTSGGYYTMHSYPEKTHSSVAWRLNPQPF